MGADLADRLILPDGLVGRSVGPFEQVIEAGWLAAYAGALGQSAVLAHPVFPVCYAELNGIAPFEYLVALQRHHQDVALDPGDWLPWHYAATLAELRARASPSR